MALNEQIVTISDDAREAIVGIRAQEPDAAGLALSLDITGVRGTEFAYELTFIPVEDAGDDDALHESDGLPVIVKAGAIDRMRGATIGVEGGGLGIDNPNTPSPKIPAGAGVAEGPVAERITALLNEQINPAIAGHGGFAELVAVEDDTAYLRLGGGCQGCGMAQVTLGQGIEVAIKDAVPEINHVVDVTDHASGDNPYYEAAKK